MSQTNSTDFPIDPLVTSGTELADILNRFKNAEDSQNAGATAPPNPQAGMLWFDTSVTPAVLRMRNANNTQWVLYSQAIFGGTGGGAVFADGTLAAPGLAWAAEPTSGWFRPGANSLSYAMSGAQIYGLSAQGTTNSYWSLFPRATGSTQVTLHNQPANSPNINQLYLRANPNDYVFGESLGGSATAKPLGITFPNGLNMNVGYFTLLGPTGAPRFNINLQSASGEANINFMRNGTTRWYIACPSADASGSDFVLARCDAAGNYAASPLNFDWSTGNLGFTGPNFAFGPSSSQLHSAGSIYADNNAAIYANGVADWGGGNYGISIVSSNPNWAALSMQALHVTGQWAGFRFAGAPAGSSYVDMQLSGASAVMSLAGGASAINVARVNGTATRADTAGTADQANRVNGFGFNWSAQGVLSYILTTNEGGNVYITSNAEFVTRVTSNRIRLGWTGASLIADVDGTQMTINTTPSERKFKEGIAETKFDSVAAIARIPFKEFRYKTDGIFKDNRLHPVGVIVDEIEGISDDWLDSAGEDTRNPNPYFMLMSAMHAIQQLTKRIETLEGK